MKRRPAIDGKVAIITGASSGIGEATAREFARAGAITVLAARRIGRLERLADEIHKMGGKALPVQTDLTDLSQITNLVQTTLSTFGRIDILANIAGWGNYDWFEELTAKDLRNYFEVNVIGMAHLIQQVIPIMKAQRSGYILNMSSYTSEIGTPPLNVYASTKYAIKGLNDSLRRELLPWGITVIRIHPSAVSGTEFNKSAGRKPGSIKYRSIPIGRVSREAIAKKIVQLVEHPRRALYYSRVYDVPVVLNQIFPEILDWISAAWVRRKRKDEIPPADQIAPVHYKASIPLWRIILGFLVITLIIRFLRNKSE
ncbi:MAG TPA: SDR family oxidoreductase [Anaerolineales bacterium]|nr:SDR family oxidoreductase [Anaerolineales bacterium]